MGDPERPERLRPLPRRLQHQRDDARGKGQAHPLAQPPGGRRGLALRQGALRVPAPARARPRPRPAPARAAARLRGDLLGRRDRPRDRAAARRRRGTSSPRSPAPRRWSSPTRSASSCAPASARTRRCFRRRRATRSTPSGCRCRRSATRRSSSSSATNRSPTARRSWTCGSSQRAGTAPRSSPSGRKATSRQRRVGQPTRSAATLSSATGSSSAERAILIWSGAGGHGGVTLAALAGELGLAEKEGSGAFHLPSAPNARGVADAWACADDDTAPNPQPIKLLVVSGDEAAADPNVRKLAQHAESVLVICMFEQLARGWARPRPPGYELPRARRHVRQPRGQDPAAAPRRHPAGSRRAGVAGEAGRALRRRAVTASRPGLRGGLGASLRRDSLRRGRRAGIAAAARRGRARPRKAPRPPRPGPRAAGRSDSSATGRSSPGPAVERVYELQFQRPAPEIELAAEDASSRGIARGRPRHGELERHLGRAARAREQEAARRRSPRSRGARRRPASQGCEVSRA